MTNIGKPERIIEVPKPVDVPDHVPDEHTAEPEPQPRLDPVPA